MTAFATTPTQFASKIEMQHRLFAELSRMFALEVPMYDRALAVNNATNTAVCNLLGKLYPGFTISDAQLERTSGERHGAIRIGRPDEYRWICRFFGCFAMEPHNYYDMTNVGAKSQPIVATAFRSMRNPEHRVFTSLLMTDYFDLATRARIEGTLATRQIFSDRAKQLIEKSEKNGGLDWKDGEELIREGSERIFKWTGQARDHQLYKDLCDAGFKIAADIACFQSHHLNHLTPNTFWIDLYSTAMKFGMGEMDEAAFRERAAAALGNLVENADRQYLRLTFRHLTREAIARLPHDAGGADAVAEIVEQLVRALAAPECSFAGLKHAGFKDTTEGPPVGVPVLLRQDAYKALTEPVTFTNADGSVVQTVHTARFGEIEQRFFATTTKGRELYDACLTKAEAANADPTLAKRDYAEHQKQYAAPFAEFARTAEQLIEQEMILASYFPTAQGLARRGTITTVDLGQLVADGLVAREGLRYEDFLPVSAAGIFASNLNQYGTQSTASAKPTYKKEQLEAILGRTIIDTDAVYRGLQAESILSTYEALGLLDRVPASVRNGLERDCRVLLA
jgi:uncharacterized glyoxalase superfamily metalloenzyme YdcJ